MDKVVIKSQISYWEAQERELKGSIKASTDQLKTVQGTIKSLKALLPKDTLVSIDPGLAETMEGIQS
jgi:prefoldin subunit 5